MQRYGTPMKARIDKRLTERGARRRHEISRGIDDGADELHPAEVRLLEYEGLHTDCAGQHDDDCMRCDEIHEEHEDHPDMSGNCPLCPDWDALADSFQNR